MNILVLNYEFPPLGGGASPVSYDIAMELARRGHHLTVVTMGFQGLPWHECINGVDIYRLKCWRNKKNVCKPWEQYSYLLAVRYFLKKHVGQNEYDVCHTHFVIPTGEVALWVKRKYAIPYIITAHGSDVEGHNLKKSMKVMHRVLRPWWKKIVNEAECVISPSVYLKELMEHNYAKGRYQYIPNGIKYECFRELSDKRYKQKRILIMGRLQRFKGVQTIIKALSMIDMNGWQVDILGDGPYKAELVELTNQCGLEDRIHFYGWLDHGSKAHLERLKYASIYISASQFENCPMSVIEAVTAGCYPLLSDIPAHRQLIEGNQFYFIKDSSEMLARKLYNRMKLWKEAWKVDTSRYAWETVIERYEDALIGLSCHESKKVIGNN